MIEAEVNWIEIKNKHGHGTGEEGEVWGFSS